MTDLGLDQVVSLCPDVPEETGDVHGTFVSYLLQHAVEDDVCACPANTSTEGRQQIKEGNEMSPRFLASEEETGRRNRKLPAVNHRWPRGVLPGSGRLADKAEERKSKFWDAHVGPLSVMVVHHRPLVAPPLLRSLQVNKTKQEMNKLRGRREGCRSRGPEFRFCPSNQCMTEPGLFRLQLPYFYI